MNATINIVLKYFYLGRKYAVLGVLKYRKENWHCEQKATRFLRCTNILKLTVK